MIAVTVSNSYSKAFHQLFDLFVFRGCSVRQTQYYNSNEVSSNSIIEHVRGQYYCDTSKLDFLQRI